MLNFKRNRSRGTLVCCAALAGWLALDVMAQEGADIVFKDARVYTVNTAGRRPSPSGMSR